MTSVLEHIDGIKVDVLIIGAGPAGCSAAIEAGRMGAKVLIIDKKPVPGIPVQCGEYIPKLLLREINISNDVVSNRIDYLQYHYKEITGKVDAPGFIINRDRLDQELLSQAQQAGAKILTNTKAIAKTSDGIIIRSESEEYKVNPLIVIGADGPRSVVSSWMGNSAGDMYLGVQKSISCMTSHTAEIYFLPDYGCGYAWFFPKGERANVGLAIPSGEANKAQSLLSNFCSYLSNIGQINTEHEYDSTSGLIPTGGPHALTVFDNMLLAGDAAGQTNPITGAGIANAIICGKMAGKWAAESSRLNNIDLLVNYDKEWRGFLGDSLSRALSMKVEIERERYSSRFFELIQKAWGFRGNGK